jgi:imidazolonepropionase-like amidohydrolase
MRMSYRFASMNAGALPAVLLIAAFVWAAPGFADGIGAGRPAQATPAGPTVALVGATLIDGTGRTPVPNSVVVVSGGRVIMAGPRATTPIPRNAGVLDVSGRWIIPGMIDAHVHFHETGRIYTSPGALDLTRIVSYDDEIAWMKKRVPVTLARYLCAGVTTAVSVGGPHFEYEVRDAADRLDKAPNVFIGHGPITAVRIGHDIFPPIDGDEATRFIASDDDARAEVRRAVAWHADLIKAGYLGTAFANRLQAQHPGEAAEEAESHFFELLPAIVAEAHAHGLHVTIHVTELDAAKQSLRAGVDSLAHTVTDKVVDDEFLRLARARHVAIMGTLAEIMRPVEARTGNIQLTEMESRCGDSEVIRSWSEVKHLPPVSAGEKASAAGRQATAMVNVKKIHDFGIGLVVGTDSGNLGMLHGASIHKEIELLRTAGIPPMDIIMAATSNAAKIAGKEAEIGILEPGKRADLVILERDPLADIRNTSAILSVMKGGRLFSEADLLP